MKQTIRYILALAAMFLFTTGAMADNTATVTKLLDGAAPTTDPGTVVYNNGKITVTPTNGNYLTVADLTVVKTTDGSNAEARRRAPGFDKHVVLTASDPTADPSGQTEFTFTVTDTKFDYKITANFHARTDISGATVTVPGDPFTFIGTAITPNVNVTVGGTPLTQGTDFDVTYASNTNAGTASFTITGTRTYNGIITGNTFTINQAAGSISYATATVNKNNFDAAFTNPLTLTGDGTVSYSSSNTAVANVNATTGEVTIVGVGTATITATVTDGPNYTYPTPTATYNLTVILASMAVTSEGYYGEYDGQAHGITVTAPDGATVRYGEAPGVYNLNASPTYTNAGGYTVYYQVTKPNYATVTGSENVAISKAPGSISYAKTNVKKTYGNANFTQPLTLTGDGMVSYATSNVDVADVDAATGEVTITGEGTATITATAIDGINYTYASETNTANYTITVAPAKMTVKASGYTGDYDGQAHTIIVTAPEGAKVKYGRSDDACVLNTAPTYTNSGTYTVFYQVTKDNYITVTGSQVVTINKAAGSISYATASVNKTKTDGAFTNPLTLTGDGKVSYTSSNTDVATVNATTGEVTINGYGTATITATVKEGVNYVYAIETATYTLIVATVDMTVSASGFTGPYDGQAHGINVTAPEGATVKYSETEGVYDLYASPAYTNVGTYTVYYQVTKTGFTTVTGSATVTITKAAGSISYAMATVNKVNGDATFINPLTLTGDGSVSYATSDAAIAAVDVATGEVTIVGAGTATITATVKEGVNYVYATETATYTLIVATADMTVSASGFTGPYDGQAHGINVTAHEGATVKYGETEGVYDLSASPTYINAGTYTVYYQVTKPNYATVTGSEIVTITKANAKVEFAKKEYTVRVGEDFDAPQVTLDPADLVVTYSSSDDEVATVDAQTGEVTLVAPGKVTITATFAGDENYNAASDSYVLEVLQRDIEPIDEDVIYAMTDDVFFVLNEDGTIEEIKLDNTVIFDLLFTLDISGDPSESDGYDETEKCIVLNTPMSTDALNNLILSGIEPGTDEYAAIYTGLTFKVPAGTGYVIIDAQTDGEHQMMVKIGELAPIAFNHTGREKDKVLYECSEPTWVYVYNGDKISNARVLSNHRAKKERGHVKIYSVTRSSSSGQGDGIELINSETLESDRWYDLQGNRIYRPTKKGVYILQGKKVIVK